MPTDFEGFPKDFFAFFRELKANNNRAWFEDNKQRFKDSVQAPMSAFITAMAPRLTKVSKNFVADPRPNGGSMFRIYRDVRFSRDKSPYKTHMGLHFRHAGSRDDVHGAGLYLHLEPGQSFLAGGCWQPDPRSLARFRDAIAWKPAEWKKATRGLELGGDTLIRPPKGYPADHPMIEDLKRKDFIASVRLSDAQVCGPKFMNEFLAGARKISPLLRFLCTAQRLQY